MSVDFESVETSDRGFWLRDVEVLGDVRGSVTVVSVIATTSGDSTIELDLIARVVKSKSTTDILGHAVV